LPSFFCGCDANRDNRFKLKRSQAAKFYREHIDELYAEVDAEEAKKGPRAKL
jgi:hypothetical protein